MFDRLYCLKINFYPLITFSFNLLKNYSFGKNVTSVLI